MLSWSVHFVWNKFLIWETEHASIYRVASPWAKLPRCHMAQGLFQHLAKLLSCWFEIQDDKCDSGFVFVGIATGNVKSLIGCDGVTGCRSIITHIKIWDSISSNPMSAYCSFQVSVQRFKCASRVVRVIVFIEVLSWSICWIGLEDIL